MTVAASNSEQRVHIQFVLDQNQRVGKQFDVPVSVSRESLTDLLLSELSGAVADQYRAGVSLFVSGQSPATVKRSEVLSALGDALSSTFSGSDAGFLSESVIEIQCEPEQRYTLRTVSRQSQTIRGHEGPILCVALSPDGSVVATGSGDSTLRLWDTVSGLDIRKLDAHKAWVLSVKWSDTGNVLVSTGADGCAIVWGVQYAEGSVRGCGSNSISQVNLRARVRHSKPITAMALSAGEVCLVATGSMDGSIKVVDSVFGRNPYTLSGHTGQVTGLCWTKPGAFGLASSVGDAPADVPRMDQTQLLVSISRDRVLKVWREGQQLWEVNRNLGGHWINCLSILSAEYGKFSKVFGSANKQATNRPAMASLPLAGDELDKIIIGNEDGTVAEIVLKNTGATPVATVYPARHKKGVMSVVFSPCGKFTASGSLDKTVNIYSAATRERLFLCSGHVAEVYCLAFAPDSRSIASGSSDSTIKIWSTEVLKTTSPVKVNGVFQGTLISDLPGHADQVFALDWGVVVQGGGSAASSVLASGGRDKALRLWGA